MTAWLLEGGYAWVVSIHGILLLGFTAWQMPGVWRGLGRRAAGMAALAMLFALAVAIGLPEPRPVVYYDEFFYVATARNLADRGVAEPLIHEWIPPTVRRVGRFLPPYPQGWPVVASLWPAFASLRSGAWAEVAALARLLWWLMPLVLFPILARRLAHSAAWVGALAVFLLPAGLRLSGSAAADGPSLFFVALALSALAELHRRPGAGTLMWLALAATFAAQLRPENGLYALGFGLAALPAARAVPAPDRWAAAILTVLLVLPAAAVMVGGAADPEVAGHFRSTPRPGFTPWGNRLANLGNDLLFFLDNRIWPVLLTLLAALGAATGRPRVPVGFLLAWVTGMTLFLAWFPFGDYRSAHSLDTWRFSLQVSLPLVVLAAAGLETMSRRYPALAVLAALACLLTPATHHAFLASPHPLADVLVAAEEAYGEVPYDGWLVVETPEEFCLLRYGGGAQVTLAPVDRIPAGGLFLFVAGHDPDPSLWEGRDLELVRFWDGRLRDCTLLRVTGP